MNEADTVAVVLVPESGDDIQMMKSGLIEIADLYVVNKSDRPGANRLSTTLNNMLDTNPSPINSGWRTPIIKTNALTKEGVDELLNNIDSHLQFMKKEGTLKRKTNDRYQRQVRSIVQSRYNKYLWRDEEKLKLMSSELDKEILERTSPTDLVEIILKDEIY